jgi:hypothetical protein
VQRGLKVIFRGLPLTRRRYTTQPIERRHVPTRDRLRGARGLRTVPTGQQVLASFEALYALRRCTVKLRTLVPGYRPTRASEHEKACVVVAATEALGTRLKKAA